MAETTPLNDLLADLECQAAMFRRLVSDWGDEPHGELRLYCDNTARPQLAELEAQIAALRASTSEARICEATAANTILAAASCNAAMAGARADKHDGYTADQWHALMLRCETAERMVADFCAAATPETPHVG
jgi:hypothetical protein